MAKLNPNIKVGKTGQKINTEKLAGQLIAGDRYALSKAITIIESEAKNDQKLASEILNIVMKDNKAGFRIGISGAPGAGKSTLIETLGNYLVKIHKKPAVLAIDPSSQQSGGSILADKTRMQHLSQSAEAFIRPSPTGKSLGGVARKTRETIILAEKAGFDPILVETVGVGQSETVVQSMTDLFILVISPGLGDEIQGIKRGIMEMADIIVINKMDGKLRIPAQETMNHYLNAISLFKPKESGWLTKLIGISALEGKGMVELWKTIDSYHSYILKTAYFEKQRRIQNLKWFEEHMHEGLVRQLMRTSSFKSHYDSIREQVLSGHIAPFKAANEILKHLESETSE